MKIFIKSVIISIKKKRLKGWLIVNFYLDNLKTTMSDNNFIRIKIKFIKTFLSPNHMKATFLSIDHSHPYCHTNHITHKLRVNETTHTLSLSLSLSLSLYIYIYIYIYIYTHTHTIPHKTACENESSWFIGGWGSYNIYIHKKLL